MLHLYQQVITALSFTLPSMQPLWGIGLYKIIISHSQEAPNYFHSTFSTKGIWQVGLRSTTDMLPSKCDLSPKAWKGLLYRFYQWNPQAIMNPFSSSSSQI